MKRSSDSARLRLIDRLVARKRRLNEQWFKQGQKLRDKYEPLIAELDKEIEAIGRARVIAHHDNDLRADAEVKLSGRR